MKKTMSIFALILSLALVFTACGDDDKSMSTEQNQILVNALTSVGEAANVAKPSTKSVGPQTISYTDPSGYFSINGSYEKTSSGENLSFAITFNGYTANGVTITGTVAFTLAATIAGDTQTITNKYTGDLTVLYNSQTYEFKLNIDGSIISGPSSTTIDYSGSASINGETYPCSIKTTIGI